MAVYTIHEVQLIPASKEIVWDFLSTADNLKNITPPFLGMQIISKSQTKKVYPGMIIRYKLSPLLGIKLSWVTEITQVKDLEYFVDEQRVGPYALWHHEHHMKEQDGGILMTDIVTYAPPFGFLGRIAHFLFIKRQLKAIFDYRRKKLEEIFPA